MHTILAAALTAALGAGLPAGQSNMAKPEKFTAFAVDVSNTASRANTTPLDITISRLTGTLGRPLCACEVDAVGHDHDVRLGRFTFQQRCALSAPLAS